MVAWPTPSIVYSRHYGIHFFGVERLHPFDSTKYDRIWSILRDQHGDPFDRLVSSPAAQVSDETLLLVHDSAYLKRLRSSSYLERALELPGLRYIPNFLLRQAVVGPMRWATAGTILSAEYALRNGAAFNLSGGYHHASASKGEGFCLFADIPLAVAVLRRRGLLTDDERIGIIDLDAHQGNGLERAFQDDAAVVILDVYNSDIYPDDTVARSRIDVDVRLSSRTADGLYLENVRAGLDAFFQQLGAARLVFYNAGTDIFELDPLGALSVSGQGVLQRDELVFRELMERQLPFVMLPSGGYTKLSARITANSIAAYLKQSSFTSPGPVASND